MRKAIVVGYETLQPAFATAMAGKALKYYIITSLIKAMDQKKILVIEDNQEVRENLEEILELYGYDVVSAEDGKIGVDKAVEEKPDLILCDVMMPRLDGFGVLNILSRKSETAATP